jgi:internalin A
LRQLGLSGCEFEDLPSKILSGVNVLDQVRAHYKDLKSGEPPYAGVKIVAGGPPTFGLKVFVSYAWGDTSANASEEDRQRQEVVERLCHTLQKERWQVVRDKTALRPGELISGFMERIGRADRVIVVLSAKYLHSPYCVTELYDIYRRSRGEKEDFLRRVIPLVLADAQIDTWRDRVTYAKHWEKEFKAMEQDLTHLGEADIRLYKAMKRWHNEVGDMLAYVNDVLVPRGFEDIVKDDFSSLRQMLTVAASEATA